MNVCERVSMFDGFAPPYTLEQWVNYSPHPTGRTEVRHDVDVNIKEALNTKLHLRQFQWYWIKNVLQKNHQRKH